MWRTFRIEARFGFNRISPRLYAVDFGKQLLLAALLGGPLLLAALALMERAGTEVVAVGVVDLAGLDLRLDLGFPEVHCAASSIDSRRSPMRRSSSGVETLLERCGFAARGGVFVMDGSLRSAHGNAYFTGIGRNKRIVFFDTLLSRIEAAGNRSGAGA